METTKVFMHGFEINIRVETGYQDVNVISDCLGGDCYALEELAIKITPKTVLDIGGHIGAFGLYAKRLWPDCSLIAVEPCKESCELYRMNLKDNGFNGTVINKGVSYNPNRTKLLYASRTSGGHIVLSSAEARSYVDSQYRRYEDKMENIEPITVEELARDIGIIDLAKWDCEGAEIDAFRKMEKETAAKFRTMVGEYHLWGDGKKLLQSSPLDTEAFWDETRRKFPHLLWSWTRTVGGNDKYGKFQAWPKAPLSHSETKKVTACPS